MKPKFFAMTAALVFCLLASLAGNSTAQTNQPNLTGTWKMNAQKTKFERGGPSAVTLKLDHKGAALAESLTVTTPGGDRTVDAKYTIGDKETRQEVMGKQAQTSAKWEGDALAIYWKAEDGSFNRSITLSPDGKTLTMIVKQTNGDGGISTDTVVLEKQESQK